MWAVAFSTAPYSDFPGWSSLLRAASLAIALAGYLIFFGLAGLFPSSRFITGTYLLAISVPFEIVLVFNHLRAK
jgi:hypothetical protein